MESERKKSKHRHLFSPYLTLRISPSFNEFIAKRTKILDKNLSSLLKKSKDEIYFEEFYKSKNQKPKINLTEIKKQINERKQLKKGKNVILKHHQIMHSASSNQMLLNIILENPVFTAIAFSSNNDDKKSDFTENDIIYEKQYKKQKKYLKSLSSPELKLQKNKNYNNLTTKNFSKFRLFSYNKNHKNFDKLTKNTSQTLNNYSNSLINKNRNILKNSDKETKTKKLYVDKNAEFDKHFLSLIKNIEKVKKKCDQDKINYYVSNLISSRSPLLKYSARKILYSAKSTFLKLKNGNRKTLKPNENYQDIYGMCNINEVPKKLMCFNCP